MIAHGGTVVFGGFAIIYGSSGVSKCHEWPTFPPTKAGEVANGNVTLLSPQTSDVSTFGVSLGRVAEKLFHQGDKHCKSPNDEEAACKDQTTCAQCHEK